MLELIERNTMNRQMKTLAAALALMASAASHAGLVISEVAPWSSGSSSLGADWFEVTNTGATAVNVSGWKMDDNSNSFASAVAMSGITSIAPGESVIFIETAALSTAAATFKQIWFGGNAPASLQIGAYSGTGAGLGTSGDAVNLYDTAGVLQANVSFGASPTGPYASFDNAAGLSGAIAQLSVAGTNGAFAVSDTLATGATNALIASPGRVSAVPESSTLAMFVAGLACFVGLRRIRG